MKRIDLSTVMTTEIGRLKPEDKTVLASLTGTLSAQLADIKAALQTTDNSAITVGDIASVVSDVLSAIAALTPNKADDVAAAIARTLLRVLNR